MESFFTANYELAPKSAHFYRTSLNAYRAYLGETLGREPVLADVHKDYADAFLAELAHRPTAKYPQGSAFRARAAATTLKRVANWLAQEGIHADRLGQSVLRNVRKPRVSNDVRQPLTDAELDAILIGAGRPGERDHAVVVFMLGTGLRLNEARELRIADLDLERRQATVRPETSKFRRLRLVDFHDTVARELDRYLRARSHAYPDAPLFPTDEGRPFSLDGFQQVFERIGERSGVPRFHAHLLRHTWATRFPGDLLELKRQGGWSRWEQVERYRHGKPLEQSSLYDPLATSKKLVRYERRLAAAH